MSEPHASEESHEGPIKTPKQLVLTVVASFVIPIVIIIMMANFVALGTKPSAGSEGLGAEAVARRLQPVGTVEIGSGSAGAPRTGEQVFQAVCTNCHTAGLLGSPKFGDAAAWAPRIAKGYAALLNSALHGKNAMPPQGGGELSDLEVGRALVYMANKGGAHFEEPKAPEGAASGAAAAASAPAAAASAAS
ncbi:MAG: cytochrome c5 family protein [Burkholderiales bacterium]|nr:cytochrome c5 family protein [Burkholderiales bacterium]MDE2455837.1 cytochrome c5 family protein [Burkholderiales bacterium]